MTRAADHLSVAELDQRIKQATYHKAGTGKTRIQGSRRLFKMLFQPEAAFHHGCAVTGDGCAWGMAPSLLLVWVSLGVTHTQQLAGSPALDVGIAGQPIIRPAQFMLDVFQLVMVGLD